jgi:Flp pilus assembly protein TadG
MIVTPRGEGRPGNVVVLFAFVMTILAGVAAIAIDGGSIMDDVQKVQAAADASALSAAEELYRNWKAGQGFDLNSAAKNTALAVAASNGFPNDGVNTIITPNAVSVSTSGVVTPRHGIFCPPVSGAFANKPGYVEVVIQYNQKRYFSSIYGSDRIQVRGRSVAEGGWRAANAGILLLDPASSGSLNIVGGARMEVHGAPLIVDSAAADAITTSGGGSIYVSPQKSVDVTGVPGYSGSGLTGTLNSGVPPTPDPLAYLPEPDWIAAGAPDYGKLVVAGQRVVTITPGCYHNGITVSGEATLIMMPGIYYMDGGGFSFTGQGSLVAEGVMIVNLPRNNSDVININGTGAITLSPPTTGLYQGISIWQQRSSTNTIYVTGNGATQLSGTFYTQHGTMNVTGNGTTDVLGSQYISWNMVVNGNGSFIVDWDPNEVGKMRILRLVE